MFRHLDISMESFFQQLVSLLPICPVICYLNLNEILLLLSLEKSIMLSLPPKAGSYSIAIHFLIFSNMYHDVLLHYTLTLLYQYHEHHILVYYLFQLCTK